jgi:hypothetical protein
MSMVMPSALPRSLNRHWIVPSLRRNLLANLFHVLLPAANNASHQRRLRGRSLAKTPPIVTLSKDPIVDSSSLPSAAPSELISQFLPLRSSFKLKSCHFSTQRGCGLGLAFATLVVVPISMRDSALTLAAATALECPRPVSTVCGRRCASVLGSALHHCLVKTDGKVRGQVHRKYTITV